MRYSLRRLSDNAGDSGSLWVYRIGKDNKVEQQTHKGINNIEIGDVIQVGSVYARSYQSQDWWITTPITKILKRSTHVLWFETRSGSTYILEIV
jgi:hypothetical protein